MTTTQERHATERGADRRPTIGVTGNLVERDGVARFDLPLRYLEAVASCNGVPVPLAPVPGADPREFARSALARVDGVLISGGDDFETESLGLGPTHPAARPVPRAKQELDLELAREALERDVPVLGICYGMQCLGLATGAGLYQHLPDDRPEARGHGGGGAPDGDHAVRALPGTKLAQLMGLEDVAVVSRHHQALSSVASPFAVSALDDQGTIEAIEAPGHPFALGVQWHPELPDPTFTVDTAHRRLVRALVEAAAKRTAALFDRETATSA